MISLKLWQGCGAVSRPYVAEGRGTRNDGTSLVGLLDLPEWLLIARTISDKG